MAKLNKGGIALVSSCRKLGGGAGDDAECLVFGTRFEPRIFRGRGILKYHTVPECKVYCCLCHPVKMFKEHNFISLILC